MQKKIEQEKKEILSAIEEQEENKETLLKIMNQFEQTETIKNELDKEIHQLDLQYDEKF